MIEQEMIDAAIAAYESGEWGEWLAWLGEQGIVQRIDGQTQVVYKQEWEPNYGTSYCDDGFLQIGRMLSNTGTSNTIALRSKLVPVTVVELQAIQGDVA